MSSFGAQVPARQARPSASLRGALIRNESGGRNIPNVHQGTSSGQAQGYFQITEGTQMDPTRIR